MENKTEQTTEVEQTELETTEVVPAIETKVEAQEVLEETPDKTNDTLDEVEKNLEKREQELLQREIKSEFKDKGLEMFADVVTITDAKQLPDMVTKLTAIVNDIKVSLSYQPVDNTKQDVYSTYEQAKDTKSMIGSKLSNLFK